MKDSSSTIHQYISYEKNESTAEILSLHFTYNHSSKSYNFNFLNYFQIIFNYKILFKKYSDQFSQILLNNEKYAN